MNNRKRRAAGDGPTSDALVFSLLGTASAVEARLEGALDAVGLSLAKAGLLHHLVQAKRPLALSELAKHQHCVRSNITQLIDRLEKDGLVRRRSDPDDRRSVRAVLTPAGKRAYSAAMRVLAEEQRAIMGLLTAADTASLERALHALAG